MARIKVDSHHFVNGKDSNMMFAVFSGIIQLYGMSCWANNCLKKGIEMVTLAESLIADAVTHVTTKCCHDDLSPNDELVISQQLLILESLESLYKDSGRYNEAASKHSKTNKLKSWLKNGVLSPASPVGEEPVKIRPIKVVECAMCKKKEAKRNQFFKCTLCNKAKYCSLSCKTKHASEHKQSCK
jgi:hypothetical protein